MSLLESLQKELEGKLAVESLQVLLGSEELKKLTDKVQSLEEELLEIEKHNISLTKRLNESSKAIKDFEQKERSWKDRNQSLVEREHEVKQKEFEQAVTERMYDLQQSRGNEFKEILHAVFKNPSFKETVLSETPLAVYTTEYDSNGKMIRQPNGEIMTPTTTTTTKEVE